MLCSTGRHPHRVVGGWRNFFLTVTRHWPMSCVFVIYFCPQFFLSFLTNLLINHDEDNNNTFLQFLGDEKRTHSRKTHTNSLILSLAAYTTSFAWRMHVQIFMNRTISIRLHIGEWTSSWMREKERGDCRTEQSQQSGTHLIHLLQLLQRWRSVETRIRVSGALLQAAEIDEGLSIHKPARVLAKMSRALQTHTHTRWDVKHPQISRIIVAPAANTYHNSDKHDGMHRFQLKSTIGENISTRYDSSTRLDSNNKTKWRWGA